MDKLINVGIFWAVPNKYEGGWNFYEIKKTYPISVANTLGFIDYPYSHYDKWDDVRSASETPDCYHYPRGRVLYDVKQGRHRIFADECLDEYDLQELVELFEIKEFELCRDEHYVSAYTKKHKQDGNAIVLTYNILRGQDKIGENLIEFTYGDTKILVELGKALDGGNELSEIEQTVLQTKYDAVIVSHYHADHAGLIEYKTDCPIFIGRGAYRIVKAMSEYHGKALASNIATYRNGKAFTVGGIKITPYLCDHSAFDSYMLLFEAGGKSILYTGDFRFHGRKNSGELLSRLPKKVDTLICEGTNIGNGKPCFSESELENKFVEIMRSNNNPVFVLQSGTNIDRLVSVYRASKRSGRILYEDNYTALIASAAGGKIPRPDIFNDVVTFTPVPVRGKRKDMFLEFDNKLGLDKIASGTRRFTMTVRPSMLGYMRKLSEKIDLSGATLIYSMWNGYKQNEDMAEFLSAVKSLGMIVVDLHTSGHASAEDIELLKKTVLADEYVTVHTHPKQFVHLHVHTQYSIADGAAKIENLFEACEKMNMPAIAMTDHGNLYGAIEFLKAAVRHTDKDADLFEFMKERRPFKVKPIIGCEVYTTDDMLNQLVLLAKNSAGYHNLIKIVSAGFIGRRHDKPCVDYNIIKAHSEGLILLSGGLSGVISQEIMKNDFVAADRWIKQFKAVFGENFYVEIQNHGIAEQKIILPHLMHLAKENGVKVVATNNVHYLTKMDAEVKKVLAAIAARSTVESGNGVNDKDFPTDEFYLKTYVEMYASLPYGDALATTLEIADKCDPYIIKKEPLTPSFIPPNGCTNTEYLRKLTFGGLTKRYGAITDAVRERAEYELQVIEKLGFADDFLIVRDVIKYAESQNIPVGTGRGSSVGSIVAYALGITKIDPLKYALVFERFLNPECVSRPDFQIDVCVERRGEVLSYIAHKYGADNVSGIATHGIFTARAAVKDVGRAYGYSYDEIEPITNLICNYRALADMLGVEKRNESEPSLVVNKLRELYQSNERARKLLDIAMKIEGMPRQIGMHAARAIICRDAVTNYVPLARTREGELVTQYIQDVNEELGFFKKDILSLTTLTDIQKASTYIKQRHGVDIDFIKLGYDDPKVYEMLSSGNTEAVFLLDSNGVKKFMCEMQPSCMQDLIAGYSLYRPVLLGAIPDFIRNKKNPDKIVYLHPLLEPILRGTYGIIVYQEQVMEILHELGGYTLGRADNVRRMMSKKKYDAMEAEREVFVHGTVDHNTVIPGCVKNGMPEDVANKIYDDMTAVASYTFNKSHAVAYAYLAYQTAYLKCYYPAEFSAAVLDSRKNQRNTCDQYLAYMQENGIPVLPKK